MADVRGPDGYLKDPYENIKIEPIEGNKLDEEKRPKKEEDREPTMLAAFIYLFKKFVGTLIKGPRKHPIVDDLEELRKLFIKLSKDNLSKDLDFLNALGFKWLDILAKYDETPKKSDIEAVKLFFDEVYAYPPGHPFSLGYYLTEHAGYKWIPVPFMEILYNMHMEFQLSPSESQLKKWIDLLDSMINPES